MATIGAMTQTFATMMARQHQHSIHLIINLQMHFSGVVEALVHGMHVGRHMCVSR